ncbi:MAG: 3-hydroxyacyl-CoA dehydrogenase NAD-binding domain-containing protein [Candidatus Nanopelagicales bacterium]
MTETPAPAYIRWTEEDGIVVLTLDEPGKSVNTMNEAFGLALAEVLQRLDEQKDSLRGVVITSAKSTFFAGGDLNELLAVDDAAAFFAHITELKALLRRLETLGVPVVAAINGTALGGGLELALSCHRRIVVDDPKIALGQPEVQLGLLPGGGGIVRLVRMLGLQKALTEVLLQGRNIAPRKALELGIVDELVGSPDQLLDAAKAWIATGPEPVQPFDRKGYKIPGGTPSTPALAMMLPAFPATLVKQLKGAPYPAPRAIMAAAVEGAQVDVDTAHRIESRYFTELVTGQIAKNMITGLFFDMQRIKSGGSRPQGPERWRATRVAVIGAGMMGAGIAYAFARKGVDVVLKDVSLEAAERGKSYSQKLLDKAVSRGRITEAQRDETLARITPTDDYAAIAGCDLMVEAVFEDPSLKTSVYAEAEPLLAGDALLASNTSTLPITGLAGGVTRPEDFIGLHFFSPVDKMQLVEIIVGEKTSDAALARAFDVVQQIGKVPIVVNDSRGFFTSRDIGMMVHEGLAMLGEGVDPMTLERAATQAGFPVGVLQLVDELTLTLNKRISDTTRAELAAEGRDPGPAPGDAVLAAMVETGRVGRSTGAGFYDYPEGGGRVIWTGLAELFPPAAGQIPVRDIQERLLFAMSLEAVRCLDEGVLRTVADGNVGSILGIGFPPWTGGALQYVDGYEGADGSRGVAGYVARADELAAAYGARFTPPDSLRELAAAGGRLAAAHA